ncbi:MAG: Tfx family DNA-binding protein [Desulfurococcaceae archaeon]|nr:Tfx family DNA-binding protein [Desulfurococcaceae archaeon]
MRVSVLTRRQEEILKLRSKGLSQTTVSKLLGTTRENVALIERRIRRRARRDLESLASYLKAVSIATVVLEKGFTVREAVDLVIREADKVGVKLKATSTELAETIKVLGSAAENRTINKRLYVFIGREGELIVLIGELPLS